MQEEIIPESSSKTKVPFGEWLVSRGLLKRERLAGALKEQNEHGGRLGEVLQRLKLLTDKDITNALAEHLSLEHVSFDDVSRIDMNIARTLPEAIARRFSLVAVGKDDNKVVVAMADPLNIVAIDTIMPKFDQRIKVVIASPSGINKAIEAIYHGSDLEEKQLRDMLKIETNDKSQADQEENVTEMDITKAAAAKAPVIRFADLLLSQAVKSRASDIHIEPQEKSMIIRMRIDGLLCEMVPPARNIQAAVVTRIKIISNMDIAERRLPQDGRFKMNMSGRDIDVRVSSIPTIYGEKIVMRILDAEAVSHDIDKLGFEPERLDEFKSVVKQPHGIIIVTGPTGSGKSTTLYSALNYLRDTEKNITTVEDPVEYRLGGINQIQVKSEIGLTFASCLRAILRQDPDIILVGEIRDKETVEIAIKASLTGHLVLSTFHTNDAPSAISRLVYMGIEPYLLSSSLNLVVAQRLVRRLCTKCKKQAVPDKKVLRSLGISPEKTKDAVFYQAHGCNICNGTGYLGRLPIFEFLVMDKGIRDALIDGATESKIRTMSQQKGYGGLLQSGIGKMLQGLTTPEELLRVTFAESGKA